MAALIVLISHSANAGLLPGILGAGFGQVGVVLFFALSGFLMMHFAVARPPNRKNLRRYVMARAGRVLPLYYLALLVATALYAIAGIPMYDIAAPGALFQDWLLIRGSSVLWSVPVEIHFYLLFPLLWWAHFEDRFPQVALRMLGAVTAFIWSWPLEGPKVQPYWLHIFIIGCGLRWLLDDGRRNSLKWKLQGLRVCRAGGIDEQWQVTRLTTTRLNGRLWGAGRHAVIEPSPTE